MADALQMSLDALCDQVLRLQARLSDPRWSRPTGSAPTSASPVDEAEESSPGNPPPSFNAADADLVLRSSDGTEFRVFKRILSEGSTFFQTMFTLPTDAPSNTNDPPTVDLAEKSDLVSTLLAFLYPIPDPPVRTLSELNDLLAVANKYDMLGVLHTLRKLLVSDEFAIRDPFSAYTIAVRHQLTEEIKITAARTFSVSLLDMPVTNDHRYITAFEFFQLIKLHRKRAKEFTDLIRLAAPSIKCPGCSRRNGDQSTIWWKDWETRAQSEIQQRPCTKITFSPAFIAKAAKAATEGSTSCGDCPLHMHNSQFALDMLRLKLDSLPIVL